MEYTLKILVLAEVVTAAVLFVGWITAAAARSKKRRLQIYVPVVIALALFLFSAVFGGLEFWLQSTMQTLSQFDNGIALITMATAFALATGTMFAYGLRTTADSQVVPAARWSRMQLALSAGAFALLPEATIMAAERLVADVHIVKMEWAIIGMLLLAWAVGAALRWKRGLGQGIVSSAVVFVSSANLAVLQLAVVRGAVPLTSRPYGVGTHDPSMIGFGLIWIECGAVAVLLVACVTAFAIKWTPQPGQRLIPLLFTLAIVIFSFLVSEWAIDLRTRARVEHPWIPYCVSWSVAFSIAAGVVLILGLERRAERGEWAAANWSGPRLALGTVAAFILLGVSLSNLDAAVTMETANYQAEANARLAQMMLPAVSPRDNAALVYQQAAEAMVSPSAFQFLDDVTGKTDPVGWRMVGLESFDGRNPKIVEYLKNRAAAVSFLREASRKSDCRFEHDYSRGLGSLLPGLQLVGEGSSLLLLDGLARAAQSDLETADADLAAILRMPRHLTEPNRVTVAVAAAIERRAALLTEKLLAERPKQKIVLRSEELKSLLGSSADDSRYISDLRRACRGEEALHEANFATLPSFFMEERSSNSENANALLQARLGLANPWLLNTVVYRLGFLADDLASYREQMWWLQGVLNMPYRSSSEYISRDLNRDPLNGETSNGSPRPAGLVAAMALPRDMGIYLRLAVEGDVLHRLMRVAYAVNRYRLKHDSDPSKLDDLVPEFLNHVPLDPFDGKPLRMKKTDKGLILYSVGSDMRDDGGVDEKDHKGDIVFRVP